MEARKLRRMLGYLLLSPLVLAVAWFMVKVGFDMWQEFWWLPILPFAIPAYAVLICYLLAE